LAGKKRGAGLCAAVLLCSGILFPLQLLAQEKSAEFHCQQGIAWFRSKQWDKAIAAFNQALALDPRHVKSYLGRGVTYVFAKQPERAVPDFNRVLELQPQGPDTFAAYLNRGLAYRDLGRYDQALADFNRALILKPDNVLALFYKASALDLSGRRAEALTALKEFVRRCPEKESTRPLLEQAKGRIKLLEAPAAARKPPGG
jgi:tetratricopeptide (TPR) repeat protein